MAVTDFKLPAGRVREEKVRYWTTQSSAAALFYYIKDN
jgi:hypothetical protein